MIDSMINMLKMNGRQTDDYEHEYENDDECDIYSKC